MGKGRDVLFCGAASLGRHRREGTRQGVPLGESIPGRGDGECKGPEAEAVPQTHRAARRPEQQSSGSQGQEEVTSER